MYVVFLSYIRPIEEVEALLAGHIEWLDRYFEAGSFIAAGRKDPRTGGMLLVREMEREALDAILAEDPFVAVAEYEVTKVNVTRAAEAFAGLKGV
ncbi:MULTISPECIES: YciI family protein [unclassified Pantoea]|uniref:YciI family protein n=1 Tax=unclassified Pantoea TaxID=2630326 RepID=UPI0023DC19E4|nr:MULTISPECIES: YciI family protein [unclassified Pantoea]MDF2042271.1 YciI family protein [Pantoea sp. Cr_R14]MDF2072616.1 YciI family protein [Pantoea sp. Cr_R13]MDF2078882.1 YciI family protein [Pantoea sp. Cr_R21]